MMDVLKTIPKAIYIALFIAALIAILLEFFWKDLAINLIAEIIGAFLTGIIVNALLKREEKIRWEPVREKISF